MRAGGVSSRGNELAPDTTQLAAGVKKKKLPCVLVCTLIHVFPHTTMCPHCYTSSGLILLLYAICALKALRALGGAALSTASLASVMQQLLHHIYALYSLRTLWAARHCPLPPLQQLLQPHNTTTTNTSTTATYYGRILLLTTASCCYIYASRRTAGSLSQRLSLGGVCCIRRICCSICCSCCGSSRGRHRHWGNWWSGKRGRGRRCGGCGWLGGGVGRACVLRAVATIN